MSRFVLGNCIDVMARIPDNAIDFILTDPPYLSVSVTVPGAPLPVMLMMTGCNLPAMRCTAYSKRRADGQLLRLEPCRSLYGRLETRRIQRGRAPRVHQKLHIQICVCRVPSRMRLHPGKGQSARPRNLRRMCWAGNIQAIVIT